MEDCIFCNIAHGKVHSWKVYEDEQTYAFLDINPVNEYHTLVIPKKHYEDIFDIPDEEAICIMKTIKVITNLYNSKLVIRNIQILNSSGREAQQDVFHIHFHIIPRYSGDKQNIKWVTHNEWCNRFDELLEKIKQ